MMATWKQADGQLLTQNTFARSIGKRIHFGESSFPAALGELGFFRMNQARAGGKLSVARLCAMDAWHPQISSLAGLWLSKTCTVE